MSETLIVIFRTILVLTILFILTKLMGKKQVSQMNIFDYTIGITIGSIAADISLDLDKNLTSGIVCLVLYGLFSILIAFLTLKNISIRRFFNGVPTILINNGKIIEKNLFRERIDINDLQEEARQNSYFDLSKIKYAILETSGKISFLPYSKYDLITKEDMKIKVKDEELLSNIIIDTKLLENNLKYYNKDKEWLDKELNRQGYKDYKNILLATIDKNNKVIIYKKNIQLEKKIFE